MVEGWSACSLRAETKPAYSNKLTDIHWQLKKLSGYEETITQSPELNFSENRINGLNGCNQILANYVAGQDGSVSFGHLGSTKIACQNQATDLEKNINTALEKTRLFALSRDGLNLMDSERNVLLALTPKAAE